MQVVSSRAATNVVTKTTTKLNRGRATASVRQTPAGCDASHHGPSLSDRDPQDALTRTAVTPARRPLLSPTRRLALEYLEAQDKLGPRDYEAAKSLTQRGASGNRTSRRAMVNDTRSVLDIERLARRADRRRDEASLHLVSHDPNSLMFRAALSPMLPSYQLAPRRPSLQGWI